MNLDERLTRVAVIGAGGKMGSGITLLLAQQMAIAKLQPENHGKKYRLDAIDVNEEALSGLLSYIRGQALKVAEKTTVMLRHLYKERQNLVENGEIIQEFVNDVLAVIRPSNDLKQAAGSFMIFEAILEKIDLKVKVFSALNEVCSPETFYFTNTSSIPIQVLDDKVGLDGRLIGYHFYNPPAVQKLVEVISNDKTRSDLVAIGKELGSLLRKKLIPSNDIAGFIGNGHFIRDGLHALSEVAKLEKELTLPGALFALNKISQELLIRPMGIFQLLDYVGIEVFKWIFDVMNTYIPGENMGDPIIDKMLEKGILGGQRSDGSQKDGFIKYEKNRPAGIYDLEKGDYIMFSDTAWVESITRKLGDFPPSVKPWKSLLMDPNKNDALKEYFNELQEMDSMAAKLAVEYMKKSKAIGEKLVSDGVAETEEEVNGVMLNGFFHLYGPINDYIS